MPSTSIPGSGLYYSHIETDTIMSRSLNSIHRTNGVRGEQSTTNNIIDVDSREEDRNDSDCEDSSNILIKEDTFIPDALTLYSLSNGRDNEEKYSITITNYDNYTHEIICGQVAGGHTIAPSYIRSGETHRVFLPNGGHGNRYRFSSPLNPHMKVTVEVVVRTDEELAALAAKKPITKRYFPLSKNNSSQVSSKLEHNHDAEYQRLQKQRDFQSPILSSTQSSRGSKLKPSLLYNTNHSNRSTSHVVGVTGALGTSCAYDNDDDDDSGSCGHSELLPSRYRSGTENAIPAIGNSSDALGAGNRSRRQRRSRSLRTSNNNYDDDDDNDVEVVAVHGNSIIDGGGLSVGGPASAVDAVALLAKQKQRWRRTARGGSGGLGLNSDDENDYVALQRKSPARRPTHPNKGIHHNAMQMSNDSPIHSKNNTQSGTTVLPSKNISSVSSDSFDTSDPDSDTKVIDLQDHNTMKNYNPDDDEVCTPERKRVGYEDVLEDTLGALGGKAALARRQIVRLTIQDYDFTSLDNIVYLGDTIEFNLASDVPWHAEHVLVGTSVIKPLQFESPLLQQGEKTSFRFTPLKVGDIHVSCKIYSDCCTTIHIVKRDRTSINNNTNNVSNAAISVNGTSKAYIAQSPLRPVTSNNSGGTGNGGTGTDYSSFYDSDDIYTDTNVGSADINISSQDPSIECIQLSRNSTVQNSDTRASVRPSPLGSPKLFGSFSNINQLNTNMHAGQSSNETSENIRDVHEIYVSCYRFDPLQLIIPQGGTVRFYSVANTHAISCESDSNRSNHTESSSISSDRVFKISCTRDDDGKSSKGAAAVLTGGFDAKSIGGRYWSSERNIVGASSDLSKNRVYEHTYSEPGTYTVYDEIYTFMTCSITVTPCSNEVFETNNEFNIIDKKIQNPSYDSEFDEPLPASQISSECKKLTKGQKKRLRQKQVKAEWIAKQQAVSNNEDATDTSIISSSRAQDPAHDDAITTTTSVSTDTNISSQVNMTCSKSDAKVVSLHASDTPLNTYINDENSASKSDNDEKMELQNRINRANFIIDSPELKMRHLQAVTDLGVCSDDMDSASVDSSANSAQHASSTILTKDKNKNLKTKGNKNQTTSCSDSEEELATSGRCVTRDDNDNDDCGDDDNGSSSLTSGIMTRRATTLWADFSSDDEDDRPVVSHMRSKITAEHGKYGSYHQPAPSKRQTISTSYDDNIRVRPPAPSPVNYREDNILKPSPQRHGSNGSPFMSTASSNQRRSGANTYHNKQHFNSSHASVYSADSGTSHSTPRKNILNKNVDLPNGSTAPSIRGIRMPLTGNTVSSGDIGDDMGATSGSGTTGPNASRTGYTSTSTAGTGKKALRKQRANARKLKEAAEAADIERLISAKNGNDGQEQIDRSNHATDSNVIISTEKVVHSATNKVEETLVCESASSVIKTNKSPKVRSKNNKSNELNTECVISRPSNDNNVESRPSNDNNVEKHIIENDVDVDAMVILNSNHVKTSTGKYNTEKKTFSSNINITPLGESSQEKSTENLASLEDTQLSSIENDAESFLLGRWYIIEDNILQGTGDSLPSGRQVDIVTLKATSSVVAPVSSGLSRRTRGRSKK